MYERLVTAMYIAKNPAEAQIFVANADIEKGKVLNRAIDATPHLVNKDFKPEEIQKIRDRKKAAEDKKKLDYCTTCKHSAPSGYSSFFVSSPTSVYATAWTQTSTPGMDTVQWGGTVTSGNFNIPISTVAASFSLPDTYKPFDVVGYNGSIWVCVKATSLATSVGSSFWALLGPGTGYVNSQTASYAAIADDAGHLLSFNSSSATTLTLPNPVPAPPAGTSETGWWIPVHNIGTGALTISNNGLTIDGVAASLTLGQNQDVLIFADATGNYETWHGVNSIVVPGIFTVSAPNGSGQVTIGLANENASTFFTGPTSGGAATPTFRNLVNADLPATTLEDSEASGTFVTGSVSGFLRMPDGSIPPAGIYRVSVNFFLQANPAAGTLDVAIGWNDGTAARATNGTLGAPADISTAALNVADGKIVVVSDGIHDITWALNLT